MNIIKNVREKFSCNIYFNFHFTSIVVNLGLDVVYRQHTRDHYKKRVVTEIPSWTDSPPETKSRDTWITNFFVELAVFDETIRNEMVWVLVYFRIV